MPEDQNQNFYHLMLRLPEDVTAPDHYLLLGLEYFESDAETIHQAAVERNIQLRVWDNSKFYKIADQITDEVVVAEMLLQDSERKVPYDEHLRRELFPTERSQTHSHGITDQALAPAVEASISSVTLRTVIGWIAVICSGLAMLGIRVPSIVPFAFPLTLVFGLWWLVLFMEAFWESMQALRLNLNAPFDLQEAQKGQQEWADRLKAEVVSTNSIGMKMVLIPPGEFLMGSPDSDNDARSDEKPQHRVRITKPFYLGQTEVTQSQWQAVMGTQPWGGYVKEGAATYVSWEDAQAFCWRLMQKEGVIYRLPTEAEWEYACRGGTTTKYSFGDDASRLGDHAWYEDNADSARERYAHQVGLKRANPFGLSDMHGNVWEWCQDWYDDGYYATSPNDDPAGTSSGSYRVIRGGSWSTSARSCRSANRGGDSSDFRNNFLGFRLARSQFGS